MLAFDNLSRDKELDFFSEGMSEEILQKIARSLDLPVIARSSSFQFRGREKAASNITRHLNVTHILDGSVRRQGDDVRITASLVETKTETTIWSGRFDRNLANVLAIHEEIATAVSKELAVVFRTQENTRAIDPLAHDHFLRARSLAGSPINVKKCIALLEKATERQPDFAEAWASLSMARALRARWLTSVDGFSAERSTAIAAADRAIELDPNAGLPLVAQSLLEDPNKFSAQEALLSNARRASPNDPEILKHMSDFSAAIGQMQESRDLLLRASELDPINPMIANNAANAIFDLGLIEEGFQQFSELRERWPAADWLLTAPLMTAAILRDSARVKEFTIHRDRPNETYRLALQISDLFSSPPNVQRETLMRQAEDQLKAIGSVELITLLLLCELNFTDEAFALVDRSSFDFTSGRTPGGAFLIGIIFGALNKNMRKDPRFLTICNGLGLCEYWVESGRWPDCVDALSEHYDFKEGARALVENNLE